MLQDDISKEEQDLLFGGERNEIAQDIQELSKTLTPIQPNEQLREEIEKLREGKDLEIAALKLKVKELEDKFQTVF